MPVPLSNAAINGPFWNQRMKVNREQSILHLYKLFEATDRIDLLKPDRESPKVLKPLALWRGITRKSGEMRV